MKTKKTKANPERPAPDLVAMRQWKGKRIITRAVVLLACLDGCLERDGLEKWLDRPNPRLAGKAPVDLLKTGEWTVLADLIGDMITGSPT